MAKPIGTITLLAAAGGMAYLSYFCFKSAAAIPSLQQTDILTETSTYLLNYLSSEPPHQAFEQSIKQLDKFKELNPTYTTKIDDAISEISYIDSLVGPSTNSELNDSSRLIVSKDITNLGGIDGGRGWIVIGGYASAAAALILLYGAGSDTVELVQEARKEQERRRNNMYRNNDDNNLRRN
jgi:hypothetical protein